MCCQPCLISRPPRTKHTQTEIDKALMKKPVNALKFTVLVGLLAGGITLLAGCGGGGATFQTSGNKTLGQELQDLQQSYDKGILTKKEYEDTKKRLIKKYTD